MAKQLEEAQLKSAALAQQYDSSRKRDEVPALRPYSAPVGLRDCETHVRKRKALIEKKDLLKTTPALASWNRHSRHLSYDATMLSIASTMPDNLQVLTSSVNWCTLLEQQKEVFDKLKASDESYRSMLRAYHNYQMLLHNRLEKVLSSL